jgi:aminoglycoside phosphotransferase (APT) family kinase protein
VCPTEGSRRYRTVYASLGGDRRVVDELCAQLEPLGFPETIDHDDLHDGQVFARDGRARILDWGDACVAHPFLTLGIAGYFADDAAIDTYLARWGDPAGLREAVPTARRLAGVARAATWAATAAIAPPDWHERLAPGLPMWIERVATPPELSNDDF